MALTLSYLSPCSPSRPSLPAAILHLARAVPRKSVISTRAAGMVQASVDCETKRPGRSSAGDAQELFKFLNGWAEDNILPLLKTVEESWQPQDFLPDAAGSKEAFFEGAAELRERAAEVPDEVYVCLVGNMITEEGLPTYHSSINSFEGVQDPTCMEETAWARWTRGWSAEENRHGDVLNKYLYLTGRVDMRQIEKTIHYLIKSGMILEAGSSAHRGYIYTSFQERATFISHGNTARLAKEKGDVALAKICGTIAADEKRHETAYTRIIEKLFEVDSDTTMQALGHMMRTRITMPASFMYDGRDADLFHHYAEVAQRVGVYTTSDYADLLEHFVRRWGVEHVRVGSGEARRAQDYVCGLPERVRKIAERAAEERARRRLRPLSVSWILGRQVFM